MNRKGFTLIELVMVLVVIGIMAGVVIPRLGNMRTTNASSFADKLRVDIRYAQNLAMTRGKRTRVDFTASSYTVSQDTSAAGNCSTMTTVTDPAGSAALSVALNAGSYAGITIGPSMACLEYDSIGKPYVCGAVGGPCSTALGGMTITVIANGATTVDTVTVWAQTGAVN